MMVIKRPRNSGKTTMLLHYMVFNSDSMYVARTERNAEHAFQLSQTLELKISKGRFRGMTDVKNCNVPLLIDDADYIIKYNPEIGFNLIARAIVITITEGPA